MKAPEQVGSLWNQRHSIRRLWILFNGFVFVLLPCICALIDLKIIHVYSSQVRDKLTGKDFNKEESLKAKEQVWCLDQSEDNSQFTI